MEVEGSRENGKFYAGSKPITIRDATLVFGFGYENATREENKGS